LQVNRRLYRCRENRMLAGVASGVAEFFGLDPTLVRILWFLSIFLGGFGILAYVGLAIIVPLEPVVATAPGGPVQGLSEAAHTHGAAAVDAHRHESNRGSGRASLFLGITLMVVGAFALLEMAMPGWTSWRQLGPLLLILFGGFLIFGAARREPAPLEAAHSGATYGPPVQGTAPQDATTEAPTAEAPEAEPREG
jgi:phage shock protein C